MSTTTMRGLNKAELKMNLDIPPFRRSNSSTGGAAAFPSVLLPVTTATTTTTSATDPAATATGGVAESSTGTSDGLGIRGLSSEPPVARPTKRRSGTQELLERDTSRARTRSPEMLLSAGGRTSRPAGAAAGSAQASSSTNATASTSSSSKSALSTLTNGNTNTSGSNKRARTSLSVSHGSTIESLASVASEALQTFPIPSPNVLSQSAGASTSSSGPQERRPVTTRRPSLVSRTSIPTDSYPAVPKSEDLSGSRNAEPSYVNKASTSTNSSLDPVRENNNFPGSLSQRRGETAAGKGLKITTLPADEVVEQAPRTAPGNIVTGPLGPNGPTGQVSGKSHGRRGTSFNGQGQFMAQAKNPGGGPHASLPTPLQAIPVSPYTVAPTQGQPSLHTQYSQQSHSHSQRHGHSHSHSHSRHPNLPPMSGSNSASATRHGSVSGAPVLDPYYAPTVTGTYSVPIPHSQHRSSISSTPGSTATYLPPLQTVPAASSSISASTSSIMETGKHAFLAHFSTLYDAFHETRTLSRSLDQELGRARMILNQLDEGWIDTLVRRENERLWNRVVELERIVEDERRLCRDRLGRLERAVWGDASSSLSSATTTTMSSSAPSSASVSAGPVGGTGLGFASLGSVGRRRGSDSLGAYTMLPTMGLGIGHEENATSGGAGGGSSTFARGMEEGGPGGLEMDESSSVVVGGTGSSGSGPFIKRERGGSPLLAPLMTTGSLVPRRRSVMSRPGTATSSTSSGSMNEFGAGGSGGLRNGMSGTGNSARRSSMNTSQGPRGEDVEMSGPGASASAGGHGHGHEGRE
ncbi:BZ3500_MvSof-1268-A1-R1_Chr3-3g06554 [Microbotryum saponariae]|uniref:BZ3500_MvSof-1268-A1-R1_Chr3-3g06554 protein n=1 Tax=Microbotryum saponariae TaxID=289078 RepID=A0A2X0LCD0_9BASI|nr:BZ3500_MvSof-1268-A1-R1_Chr3-3g06554 [Microbotryum saponariae]SDA04521.1 BZ3501_MvSof-1269-A2-R1_Chr3-2g06241 [Microbotryum saponariae]